MNSPTDRLLLSAPPTPLLLPATVERRLALDTVVCSDALTFLRGLPDASVDAIITDPPYGLAGRTFEVARDMRGKDARRGAFKAINESWDQDAPIAWMNECRRILKPGGSVIVFGGRESIYRFAAEGLRLGWRLINDVTWVKPDPPPNFTGRMMTESTERFLWFCPSGERWTYNNPVARLFNNGTNLRDVWYFRSPHEGRVHPAQKPLDLMEQIVSVMTRPGDIVVDPFVGSGTTALAAKRLGRHYIGCDQSPEYVDMARARIDPPMPLFDALDPPAPRAVQAPLPMEG